MSKIKFDTVSSALASMPVRNSISYSIAYFQERPSAAEALSPSSASKAFMAFSNLCLRDLYSEIAFAQ